MKLDVRNASLMIKFLLPILVCTISALLIGAFLLVGGARQSTENQMQLAEKSLKLEQKSAADSAYAALVSKADSLGRFMAKTAPDLIMSYDFTSLGDYQASARKDPDVAYAAYLKPDNTPITAYKKPKAETDIVEFRYKIISDDELIGYVLLGMSKVNLNKGMHSSEERIKSAVASVTNIASESITEFKLIISMTVVFVLLLITAVVYYLFKSLVVSRLHSTTDLMFELADGNGDLTRRLPTPNSDEISELCEAVNIFIKKLQGIVKNIVADVESLTNEANSLKLAGSELSISSDTQRMETTQVATAMNQMTATVQEVARNATNAAEAAEEADKDSRNGKSIVNSTMDAIDELSGDIEAASQAIDTVSQDSEIIGGVLDVIRGIAEQTNLLALNAAIEAARAGEQGRGFAVVADEVRTLASRTQSSTEEIQSMIERLQSGSKNAVNLMATSKEKALKTVSQASEADTALVRIASAVSTINEMNTQIATAATQQSTVAEDINKNVDTINAVSESTADSAQKTAQSSHTLSELADNLQNLVSNFRV